MFKRHSIRALKIRGRSRVFLLTPEKPIPTCSYGIEGRSPSSLFFTDPGLRGDLMVRTKSSDRQQNSNWNEYQVTWRFETTNGLEVLLAFIG